MTVKSKLPRLQFAALLAGLGFALVSCGVDDASAPAANGKAKLSVSAKLVMSQSITPSQTGTLNVSDMTTLLVTVFDGLTPSSGIKIAARLDAASGASTDDVVVPDLIRGDYLVEAAALDSRGATLAETGCIFQLAPNDTSDLELVVSSSGIAMADAGGRCSASSASPTGLGTLVGEVVELAADASRTPLASAAIDALDSAGQSAGRALSDQSGRYALSLPPGNYTLRVTHPGAVTANASFLLPANQTLNADILLLVPDSGTAPGIAAGTVLDATANSPIASATLTIRSGLYSPATAAVAATLVSSSDGSFKFNGAPGSYTAAVSKAGFEPNTVVLGVVSGATVRGQNVFLTTALAAGSLRAVLTWGATPPDLDLHLTGPLAGGTRFHVFFQNRTAPDNSAQLDHDVVTGFGPETITINSRNAGVYRFSVDDFTDRASNPTTNLSFSQAQVKLFDSTGLLKTFSVPVNQPGTLWEVFELDGVSGAVTPLNTFTYVSDPATIVAKWPIDLLQEILEIGSLHSK